jgi:hypothetical protein
MDVRKRSPDTLRYMNVRLNAVVETGVAGFYSPSELN